MIRRRLALGLLLLGACSDGIGPGVPLPPDTAHGTGLLLPWSELRGHIVYATPREVILVDALNREVRVIRQVLSDEIPREIDLAPSRAEFAMETLVDRAPSRITVTRVADGVITRTIANAACPRYLRDGRLSYMLGDTVLIEGARVTVVQPAPTACPTWAADGSFFIVTTGTTVRRIALQTSTAQTIIAAPGAGPLASWFDPDMSPNGQTLALVSAGGTHSSVIYLSATDGSNLRSIGSGVGMFGLRWSPDATQLLAATVVTGTAGLYLYRVTDGGSQRLTNSIAYAAAWR